MFAVWVKGDALNKEDVEKCMKQIDGMFFLHSSETHRKEHGIHVQTESPPLFLSRLCDGCIEKLPVAKPLINKRPSGLDAVVSTIGRAAGESCQADSDGNINVIEAAAKAGVKKFILVTSIGTGESKAGTPPKVYESLKPVLIEKEKAEERLKAVAKEHGMDFVIIR